MFQFVLRRGRETDVPRSLLTRLDLFKRTPELVDAGRYTIKSDVDSDVFGLFMTRFYGADSDVGVTSENAEQLRALCDELGFTGFDNELRAVLGRGVDLKVRKDLVGVRSRVDRHDVLLEELQRRVLELESQLQEVRALPQRVETVEQRLEATERAVAEVQRRDVSEDIESLKREVRERASAMEISEEVSRLKEAEAPNGREFVYRGPPELDGIIAHLTRECGGNVHKKGVVAVTASSWVRRRDPESVADLLSYSILASSNMPNSWVCYDFGRQRVTPTSYSIRVCGDGPGGPHLKSWVLEVSNDGSEDSWKAVDSST